MKSCFISFMFLVVSSALTAQKNIPIDSRATRETTALFANLMKLSELHTLFGHQHAMEYGHGWSGDDNRSDVKSVVGSHPAVIGIDFMSFSGSDPLAVRNAKAAVRKAAVDTYNRGGVITAAWHFSNPVSGGGFNWKENVSLPAVRYIIPGGEAHAKYKETLKGIAEWAHSIRGADGQLAPVIFRPYHEFDGGWFWWGKPHCTRDEFISLWQFTVGYLRDSLDVHNFLYAFSPDNQFTKESEYLERYPGDAWVDLLGVDNYGDMGRDKYDLAAAASKLKIVSDYAVKAGKLAAFTETGLESIPNATWWTGTLLKTMRTYDLRLAYVLVWRNDIKSPTHYYAPYPGQASASDFITFYNDEYTLFQNDLSHIYR